MVSSVVIAVFSAGVIAQLMKIITSSFTTKKINFNEVFNMGGMPSSQDIPSPCLKKKKTL